MATYEWESVTLGQNPEIQKIVSAAAKASELLNTNVGLAKSGLQLAQKFLLGVLNPKIILLNAIADEIDNFCIFVFRALLQKQKDFTMSSCRQIANHWMQSAAADYSPCLTCSMRNDGMRVHTSLLELFT